VKTFNYCSSIIAINEGNGKFKVVKMPAMEQLSSVNAIHCTDINDDGKPDIVLGGNEFGFLPQFERLDANLGSVLLNNGKGEFTDVPNNKTGLLVKGQVRDIQEIKAVTGDYILFLQNDDYPAIYRLRNKTGSKYLSKR
jgi:enediyne biosynthesis protein E4